VAGLALIDVASGFVFGGVGVLTVLLASDLGSTEEATGFLNAAIGVGGILGALVSGALVLRSNLGLPLLAGCVLVAVGLTGLGASQVLAVALVTMTIASAGSLLTEVVSTTIFQRVVPDEIRGRATGVVATISTLAFAAGGLLIPILSDAFGPLPVLAGGSAAILLAAIAGLLLVGRAARRDPDPAIAPFRRAFELPLFTGVPPAAIEAAASRLLAVSVEPGTVVVREGEPAERFYIVERGTFAVETGGDGTAAREIRTLGEGDVFGEIGLLRRGPRTATVRATSDGRLLALPGSDFLELVGAGPGLTARLLDVRRFALAPTPGSDSATDGEDVSGG
jgi:MFS family permease